jgi:hypothetical protein
MARVSTVRWNLKEAGGEDPGDRHHPENFQFGSFIVLVVFGGIRRYSGV